MSWCLPWFVVSRSNQQVSDPGWHSQPSRTGERSEPRLIAIRTNLFCEKLSNFAAAFGKMPTARKIFRIFLDNTFQQVLLINCVTQHNHITVNNVSNNYWQHWKDTDSASINCSFYIFKSQAISIICALSCYNYTMLSVPMSHWVHNHNLIHGRRVFGIVDLLSQANHP